MCTKSKTFLVFISVMVLLSFFFLFAGFKSYRKTIKKQPQVSAWSEQWNFQRSELYSGVPIDSGDIVFIGDSHIERFLLNEYYPNKHIRNRGIGSNTSFQVLDRLRPILQRHPSKVFVLIGVNDLAFGFTTDSVIKNIAKITNEIRAANAVPYIISILPTMDTEDYLNPAIIDINTTLQILSESRSLTYIDLYRLVSLNNKLDPALTIDKIHLNSVGYKRCKEALDRYIN